MVVAARGLSQEHVLAVHRFTQIFWGARGNGPCFKMLRPARTEKDSL
jgi:hypothetical protein